MRKRKRAKEGDFTGFQEPDVEATRALLHDKVSRKLRVEDADKKLLASLVTGAVRPLSRPYKAEVVASSRCPFCMFAATPQHC